MIGLDLKISERDLAQLGHANSLLEPQVQAACRRAVAKVSRWARGRTAKEVRNKTGAASSAVRARLGEYRKTDFSRKVWVGLNSLPASAFGRPSQTPSGVRVGKYDFPGAFVVHKYKNGVYQRVGKSRFPIKTVRVDISEQGSDALQAATDGVDERFMTILMQEIRYEVSKKSKA